MVFTLLVAKVVTLLEISVGTVGKVGTPSKRRCRINNQSGSVFNSTNISGDFLDDPVEFEISVDGGINYEYKTFSIK